MKEVIDINTIITSKEAILQVSRELVKKQGWSSINIRNVAKACNISVGSIYNYFDSKSALISETIESIWNDIFHPEDIQKKFDNFETYIEYIFLCMEQGNIKYPEVFSMHAISFIGENKAEGKRRMERSWKHIKEMMHHVLTSDKNIRSDAFDETFTPEVLVELVFSLILSALLQQDYDCRNLSCMIHRILYQ